MSERYAKVNMALSESSDQVSSLKDFAANNVQNGSLPGATNTSTLTRVLYTALYKNYE